jgi:hypothetical protein
VFGNNTCGQKLVSIIFDAVGPGPAKLIDITAVFIQPYPPLVPKDRQIVIFLAVCLALAEMSHLFFRLLMEKVTIKKEVEDDLNVKGEILTLF